MYSQFMMHGQKNIKSYAVVTGSFPGDKVAGAWRWPPTSPI